MLNPSHCIICERVTQISKAEVIGALDRPRPWEGFYEKTSNRDESRKLHSFRMHIFLAHDCVPDRPTKLNARRRAHELWAMNSVSRQIWNRFQCETWQICLLRRKMTHVKYSRGRWNICVSWTQSLSISDHQDALRRCDDIRSLLAAMAPLPADHSHLPTNNRVSETLHCTVGSSLTYTDATVPLKEKLSVMRLECNTESGGICTT